MAECAGNPPSRVLGLHSQGSHLYKTACSSSARGSWGVWMMLATRCCRSWMPKKPSVLQEADIGEVACIAGAGYQRNSLGCRNQALLATGACWAEHTAIRKENSLPQCLSSALYWTKTKFNTHQLAGENNWDDPLHFCSTDNEDSIWSWETIDWEVARSQVHIPRGGTMTGLASAIPGWVSHLCWKWNCIHKKRSNKHGQAGARKLTDHQAALALQGRETPISVAREIACPTHQGHSIKPHHGLKRYSSRLPVLFYSNMQLTKKPDVSSCLTKTRWEIDLSGGYIFCCLKRDIIHHNLINQCLMLTAWVSLEKVDRPRFCFHVVQ